jgi:hypothetical protein
METIKAVYERAMSQFQKDMDDYFLKLRTEPSNHYPGVCRQPKPMTRGDEVVENWMLTGMSLSASDLSQIIDREIAKAKEEQRERDAKLIDLPPNEAQHYAVRAMREQLALRIRIAPIV